ncbi:inosine/guanosine kinase [Alginatibacterium sediminis]|uniref:Inosine/guanosine kinase n=1 Tax=Alginatibacterium sediminis TaxID=2164068 RepID=A0A420EIG2_9ALTE|nr:inosine/guanosine kinase [Alginatibacterium sediminis]RKF20434.1 inosine/guanosine kinase [Alginatibacterium sediminis]
MKFPGKRKSKHFFPVAQRQGHRIIAGQSPEIPMPYIVGIDQTLVDIEAKVSEADLQRFGLPKGQSSLVSDEQAEALYQFITQNSSPVKQHAGGSIANTLHNYSVLANGRSVQLGVMSENIGIGSYAYRYLCDTSSKVDLDQLQGVDGPIGRCFTLISEDGQRTFAISGGKMNYLREDSISQGVVASSAALVLTAYLVRSQGDETITDATFKAIEYAKAASVPVVLTLGTRFLIEQDPDFWKRFVQDHVTVLAMNEEEALALTGESEPLLAIKTALQWCDLVLCTAGSEGLFIGSHCEHEALRKTKYELQDSSLSQFNQYEFSRAMRYSDCSEAVQVYSHIAPYLGGPEKIANTNGAGDGALSALLHDMSANTYHRQLMPNSAKQDRAYLSYSSIAQICKYANRVSYQVLNQHSPRLNAALPEREDSLEESYWDR